MKKLNISSQTDFLEWNHAWLKYQEQKYPMFQIKLSGSSEFVQEYRVINEGANEVLCVIHLTSRNLGEVLDLMEANRRARKSFSMVT